MKNYCLLLVFTISCSIFSAAQIFQYSKSSVKLPSNGEVRLVADIGGFHHLIHFSENKKPDIYIYNSQLHLVETLELDIKLTIKCDIRLLQMKGYYILYIHKQKHNNHQFIKITGEGAVSNISHIVNNPADSLWNRSAATFQMFDADNNLVLTSLTYLEEIRKIRTAVISPQAKQRMLHQLKYAKLHRRTDRIEQLARDLNEKVQGWVSYFGKYAGSSMHSIYAHINRRLVKWCMWKYRKFKRQAIGWLKQKWQEKPMLFVHWQQTRWFCYYNRNVSKQVRT